MAQGLYIVRGSATVSTAVSLAQFQTGASKLLRLYSAKVTQDGVSSSQQARIGFLTKSVAATFAATQTPLKTDPGIGAASGTYHGTAAATAEGTDGTTYLQEGFNVLNGFWYEPVPERRLLFPVSSIVALKFLAAPVSATWSWEVYFEEVG